MGNEAARQGEYDKAYEIWQALAEEGDAHSQFSLGVLYENAQAVKQDYTQARFWYNKAADQGLIKAHYNLGNMFFAGRGMSVDLEEAFRHFRIAADRDYAPAQYNLAYMLEQGQTKGLADVMAREEGSGVEQEDRGQDLQNAFDWYQKAANKGLPQAQFKLGQFYATGRGVEKDTERAIHWYKKLVEAEAQPDARYPLAMLWLEENETQEKGVNLLRKVAEEGQRNAQYQLGYLYGLGKGVTQDYEQATFWYYRAAQQRVPKAQYLLCLSYSLGKGVPVDILRAHVWCEAAAKQKVDGSQEALQSIKEAMSPEELEEARELALVLHPSI